MKTLLTLIVLGLLVAHLHCEGELTKEEVKEEAKK